MWNLKGRSPFHVLAKFTDRNTGDIFSSFMEYMPEYPVDKPDSEGNTPLLSAYIKVSFVFFSFRCSHHMGIIIIIRKMLCSFGPWCREVLGATNQISGLESVLSPEYGELCRSLVPRGTWRYEPDIRSRICIITRLTGSSVGHWCPRHEPNITGYPA